MSNVLDSKRLSAAALALAFALTATSSLLAMADAPPGAYLQSTTKSQSFAGSAQKNDTINSPPGGAASGGGTRYGQPLSDNLNTQSAPPNGYNAGPSPVPYTPGGNNPNYGGQQNFGGQGLSGWQNPNPGPQAFQQEQPPSMPYNGYAQQSNAMPQNYPPQQQNYAAQPPPNMNQGPPGSNWQADYPSLSELNGGGAQQAPLNANAQVNVAPAAAATQAAPNKPVIDDATLKTIGKVANTVLPIATTMMMNKMMYGTVAPRMMPMGMGNYGGYGYNPYGPMGNPMGGYGYNRPNMYNNGMMGGGNGGLGGLLNGHF